jgi:DNA (cytosine-5)-methyltransferase 1
VELSKEAVLPSSDEYVPSRIPSSGEHHQPWMLTTSQREAYRQRSAQSRLRKAAALRGDGPPPLHALNTPVLDPMTLMPERRENGIRSLSLFSGGGGLDLGFVRAGFSPIASYELLRDAAATLEKAIPGHMVFGGEDGDVRSVKWENWRGSVDIVHGGPPCQPFSSAGRQQGYADSRDGWPAFVDAVLRVSPAAFVAENVPALASAKFADYVNRMILAPLGDRYRIAVLALRAEWFGVPQVRRRVFFVGFRSARAAKSFVPPVPTHGFGPQPDLGLLRRCLGAREALGLPNLGVDDLCPTIRSSLTGPRHTTSIVNSVAALRVFNRLQIWPNGVAPTREQARAFVAENGHFRLSVPDVAVLQGFPQDWPFVGATYMQLGQIGNAVPPPLAWQIASAVAQALTESR